MEVTKVRLPADDLAALDELGTDRERSRSYLIRKAVQEYLARHRPATATSEPAER
jgi:predicted transcriptional regulator